MMNTLTHELRTAELTTTTRRHFLRDCSTAIGALWLAAQTPRCGASLLPQHDATNPLSVLEPPRQGRVKRIIYLHMVGAPSQLELFEYKPDLARLDGQECPQEFLVGKRFAFIQGTPRMLGPQYPFKQYGETGARVSDRLPHFSQHVDDVCFLRAVVTDQFNHGPAKLMVHTGQPRIGYPSIGSWVTWGLGSENENLPGFMVLLSGGRLPRVGKALWGSGFLPSVYQGVQCRSQGDPVLNISNPEGITRNTRRAMLDTLDKLNRKSYETYGDPETLTRIAQYEMTFRMQTAVPEVMNIDDEPQHIHDMYGTEPGKESLANNCLLARRLAERGVRFIQLYDWGWDSHGADPNEALNAGFKHKCRQMDRPVSALLVDLKQRGLLDDTLVIWGGEFGRTPMRENRGGTEMKFIGRDHNPGAFTMWLAGAGIKSGFSYGETDPVGYAPISGEVHVRDFHATLLHLLGLDHRDFSYKFQGLEQKLTGVLPARVVTEILSDG
jgi:hypothetical protein